MLNSKFFTSNRKVLKEKLKDQLPIVVFSNGLMQRSRDTEYPFEQDRNFFYLTGIDLPEWILVMDENNEYLISPERTEQQEIFDGTHDIEKAKATSGIKEVVDHKTGLRRLQKHKDLHANVDYKNKPYGVYSNPFSVDYLISHKVKISDITEAILALRTIKSSEELVEIENAIKTTEKGFAAAKKQLTEARNEADIQAVFDAVFAREHSEHAYSPIVASGEKACTLHYVNNRGKLTNKGLVLLDIGARSNYYAADITRTWVLDGSTKRQRQVTKAVKSAFDEIIGHVKPGLHFKDYQAHVDKAMSDTLKELKLDNSEDGLRRYLPHAPSHGLGLDVHDPIVGYEEFTAGMVITLEPGIYIPEEGIGVRYEDDLLITDNGVKNLSESIR